MRSDRIGTIAVGASLLPVLVGAMASGMLAVDYVKVQPVFCADGSACDALRRTAFALPLGVPLPFVGLVGFGALGFAALLRGVTARRVQLALGAAASLVGILLLLAQTSLHRFCPYCCVADLSGVAAAGVSAWRLVRANDVVAPRPMLVAGAGALAVAVVVPFAVGLALSPRVPDVIQVELARTPRGVVTVVDFVDFECPFCRTTHAALAPLLAENAGHVRLVRRQVPLRSHPHAPDAARAAHCGERLGKGDAMADALFAAPISALTPEGCDEIAERLGLPVAAFRACVTDPATDARIAADRAEWEAAGGRGLPTIWIDRVPLVGVRSAEQLTRALRDAMSRH